MLYQAMEEVTKVLAVWDGSDMVNSDNGKDSKLKRQIWEKNFCQQNDKSLYG